MNSCAAIGCSNSADPRWFAHHPSGGLAMICDGHDGTPCSGGTSCTCPAIREDALAYERPAWMGPRAAEARSRA